MKIIVLLFVILNLILINSCNILNKQPTKITILNYIKLGLQIDSLYSYNITDIQALEALISSQRNDSLNGSNDYNFRFWIGHGLGMHAYCIEAIKLDGQLNAQILKFSVKNSTSNKIIKTEPIPLNQSDLVTLDSILTKHNMNEMLQSARNGLGEPGADGGWLYFQYFTTDKLILVPVDCTSCLLENAENSQLILKILYTFNKISDLNKISYLDEVLK